MLTKKARHVPVPVFKKSVSFASFLLLSILWSGKTMAQAYPGGVSGATGWLRADTGITATGVNITSWKNLANNSNNFTGTASPKLTANVLNFSPSVTFSGTNYFTSQTAIPAANNSNYTKFVVFLKQAAGSGNMMSGSVTAGHAFYGAGATSLRMFHNGALGTETNPITDTRHYIGTARFSSGTTNGSYINVNGTQTAPFTTAVGYTTSRLQIGAYVSGNNFYGNIAEAIIYPSALTPANISLVESYLGVKYGITLGHNYQATDGTVTYNTSTYANNIAGIGRDDNTILLQKQGKSNLTTATQVIMSLGAAQLSNAANTGSFAADKQFLIWGDAGAAGTTIISDMGLVNRRLTRIWKITNTGNITQTVRVMYPVSGLNVKSPLLFNSTDASFGAGDATTTLNTVVYNGVSYYYADVVWPAGTSYFTFGGSVTAPGNIGLNLGWWFKGDAGITKSGTSVTTWKNQSEVTGLDVTQATAANMPKATTYQNFNPVVTFNGSTNILSNAGGYWKTTTGNTSYNVFAVTNNYKTTGVNAPFSEPVTAGAATRYQTLFVPYNGNVVNGLWNLNPTSVSASAYATYTPYLWTGRYAPSVNVARNNGANIVSGTTTAAFAGASSPLAIGGLAGTWFYNGNIGEVLMYKSDLTATQRQQVESYLALKWGVTLNQTAATSYLSSDGTTAMWNATTAGSFKYNIAGIGRDDLSGLYQKQSQSVNAINYPTIGIGTVAATNAANTNTLSDKNFLSWADDNGAQLPSASAVPAGTTVAKWLTRKWQIQETGSVGTVRLLANSLGLGSSGALYLIVANNAAFTSGVQEVPMFSSNGRWGVDYDFDGVKYFTFGIKGVPEICGNGVDDDLNGIVDDIDACPLVIPSCTGPATGLSNFGIRQEWVSPTADEFACSVSPTIADLNGDGKPEILVNRAAGDGITVYQGDGSDFESGAYDIQLRTVVNQPTVQTAVADIEGDGIPEVITVGADRYVYVFNNVKGSATNYKYRSATMIQTSFIGGSPRVSDINEDGVPEIIVGLDVFQFNIAAGTLTKRVAGSTTLPFGKDGTYDGTSTRGWGNEIVVIDIIPSNPGKEIVAGSKVYGVNLTAGTLTTLSDLSTIAGSGIAANDDGPTAVADLDQDGTLDIVYPSYTSGATGNIVMWDPVNNVLKAKMSYNANSIAYTGMPAIANVYNEKTLDGKANNYSEVIFTSSRNLFAYNLNKLTGPVWTLATTDNSGQTGLTAFDLNGDGTMEIIYNDETQIRVINGNAATPTNLFTFASGTATWMEHPVVADVDNDGAAEFICVSGVSSAQTGVLRVFGSSTGTVAWQPARKLWNQRGYRSSNVNDNLSIPVKERNTMSEYPPGSGFYNYNVYNLQVNTNVLTPGTVAMPNASTSLFRLTPGVCSYPSNAASVDFTVTNSGSATLPAGTPIRFYVGNPAQAGAVRLAVTATLEEAIPVGESAVQTQVLNLSAYTLPITLYVIANDNGTDPVPVNLPIASTNVSECDYTNNTASFVLSSLTGAAVDITTQPSGMSICLGNATSFSVTPGGTGPFAYQWQYSTNGTTWTDMDELDYSDADGSYSDATTSTLNITANTTTWTGYQYRASVARDACATTTNPVTLSVLEPADYGDLDIAKWPVANAGLTTCTMVTASGSSHPADYDNTNISSTSVWAGASMNTESASVGAGNTTASTDNYDDGLGSLVSSGYNTYDVPVSLNANQAGTTVYYRLWFDWNNDGNFANDLDGNGNPATYAGSAVVTAVGTPVIVPVSLKAPFGVSPNYKQRLVVSDAPIDDVYRTEGSTYVLNIANGEVEDYNVPTAIILPLTLVSFDAASNGCTARLNWVTASEQNTSYFEIEQSTNGTTWTTASKVTAAGNSQNGKSYASFINLKEGVTNYLRLKMMDKDGHFTYSAVKTLRCNDSRSIVISPNPVKDQLFFSGLQGISELRIINNLGQVLKTVKVSSANYVMNVGDLLQGFYVAEIVQDGQKLATQKIIKE